MHAAEAELLFREDLLQNLQDARVVKGLGDDTLPALFAALLNEQHSRRLRTILHLLAELLPVRPIPALGLIDIGEL